MLTQIQMDQFEKKGFLVLKGVIDEGDIHRLERGVANNPPLDGTLDPNAPLNHPEILIWGLSSRTK